jgi:hypothetical protein
MLENGQLFTGFAIKNRGTVVLKLESLVIAASRFGIRGRKILF